MRVSARLIDGYAFHLPVLCSMTGWVNEPRRGDPQLPGRISVEDFRRGTLGFSDVKAWALSASTVALPVPATPAVG